MPTLTPTGTATSINGLVLAIEPPQANVVASASASYAITVTNSSATSQSYTLAVSDSLPGSFRSTTAQPSLLDVPPAGSVTTTLSVSVAARTKGGTLNITSVTVASTTTSSLRASTTVTTGVIEVAFDRDLSGEKVGQHKVPPTLPVLIEIRAAVSDPLQGATLADIFPSSWTVVEPQGGVVSAVDAAANKISWAVGDLVAGQLVNRAYTLSPPERTLPPSTYELVSELRSGAFAAGSAPWDVIVADPVTTQNLHAVDVQIGPTTYNTVNTGAPVGTLATASASLAVRQVDVVLADPANISIFASNQVPSGKVWDLAGTWTFRTYMRATLSTRLWMRAKVYRLDANGTATQIAYSQDGTRRDVTTSYQLFSWNYTMPANTILNAGERFGVEFYVYPDSDEPGQFAYLGFDTTAQASRVDAQVAESDAPARVREAHYRIGKDTPLSAMDWHASTDSPATSLQRNTNLRVRFQLYNDGGTGFSWTPRIEYTTTPGSGYAVVPTTSGAAPFFVVNTSQFVNGDTIPTIWFGLGVGSGAAQNGVAYDTVNQGSTLTLNGTSYTEVEFSVQANNNAVEAQPYYFRLTNAGTPLATYDSGDAQVIVAPPWPATPTPGPPAHNFNQPYTADTSACAACHRVHTSPAPQALEKRWPQEQTCFTCHDGTGAPNVLAQFNKPYTMPLTTTSTLHNVSEARTRDAASFSGANRHVACTDCHNPHYAAQGTHPFPNNYAFGPLQNVWGIAVSNGGAWTEPTYSVVSQVQFEYQVCFKCHSSWAYGTSPPTAPSGGFPETNQAKEFNPGNHSQMPVEDVGRNPFRFPNGTSYASSLINGASPTSRMTCTDCHRSETDAEPKGPHGSNNPFILRRAWNRQTGRPGTQNDLCFLCHSYNVYVVDEGLNNATGFSGGRPNLHAFHIQRADNRGQPAVCMDCHVAVPHGYNRDHLLGFTTDGAPYIDRPLGGGLLTIDQWAQAGQWQFNNCTTAMNLGCHGP